MPNFLSATADIQGDYRYTLTRVWDENLPVMTFVLLNPSTGDENHLDRTPKRCVRFALREGYGAMKILNLYAYRSPYPKVMRAQADPVGPKNDQALAAASGMVVAGWGAGAKPARVAHARTVLPKLHALAVTPNGHPQHPLYVLGDSPLMEWPAV